MHSTTEETKRVVKHIAVEAAKYDPSSLFGACANLAAGKNNIERASEMLNVCIGNKDGTEGDDWRDLTAWEGVVAALLAAEAAQDFGFA